MKTYPEDKADFVIENKPTITFVRAKSHKAKKAMPIWAPSYERAIAAQDTQALIAWLCEKGFKPCIKLT